jgi:hypothetical protein
VTGSLVCFNFMLCTELRWIHDPADANRRKFSAVSVEILISRNQYVLQMVSVSHAICTFCIRVNCMVQYDKFKYAIGRICLQSCRSAAASFSKEVSYVLLCSPPGRSSPDQPVEQLLLLYRPFLPHNFRRGRASTTTGRDKVLVNDGIADTKNPA